MTAKSLWKWFRKHEKMILAAIAVLVLPAFGFGGLLVSAVVGKSQKRDAAEIDGETLSLDDYNKYQRSFVRLGNAYFGYLKSNQHTRDAKWGVENMDVFKHVAMVREARRRGLEVTDGEVTEVLEGFQNAQTRLPYLRNPWSYMINRENLLYMMVPQYHLYRLYRGKGFDAKIYERFLARLKLTDEDFREFLRELLLVLKLKYFMYNSCIVPTTKAFETYKAENLSLTCAYVRLDAKDYIDKEEKLSDEEVKDHFNANRARFQEPIRRRIEFIRADLKDVKRRVVLTESEKREFYDKNKDLLFRAPAEKKEDKSDDGKKDDEKENNPGDGSGNHDGNNPDDDKEGVADGSGGEQPVPPGEEPSQPEPADPASGDDASGEEEQPEPEPIRYKPFEDPDVQDTIESKLRDGLAREFLQKFMNRLSGQLKSLTQTIQSDPSFPRQEVQKALAEQIDLERICAKLVNDRDWVENYLGLDLTVVRDQGLRSVDELRQSYGKMGSVIADQVLMLPLFMPSDVVEIPGQGYVLFRSIEERPPMAPPLETVRDKVEEDLRLTRALDHAKEKADAIRAEMTGAGFEGAAGKAGLKVLRTAPFKKGQASVSGDGENPAVGTVPGFVAMAFTLGVDQISQPIVEKGAQSVFLLTVEKKIEPEPTLMGVKERDRLLDDVRRELWKEKNLAWGEEFKKHHQITDFTRDRRP